MCTCYLKSITFRVLLKTIIAKIKYYIQLKRNYIIVCYLFDPKHVHIFCLQFILLITQTIWKLFCLLMYLFSLTIYPLIIRVGSFTIIQLCDFINVTKSYTFCVNYKKYNRDIYVIVKKKKSTCRSSTCSLNANWSCNCISMLLLL